MYLILFEFYASLVTQFTCRNCIMLNKIIPTKTVDFGRTNTLRVEFVFNIPMAMLSVTVSRKCKPN